MANTMTRARALADVFTLGIGLILATGVDHVPREIAQERSGVEVRHANIHLRSYRSSVDPNLQLWALIRLPIEPGCISVTSHGWHGAVEEPDPKAERRARLTIEVDMRGRGHSSGKPDLSGWELQDWVDAVEFAKREYREFIRDPDCVYAEGGSGAGGNVYALVGKFPDYFAAGIIRSGMSDYTLQYRLDETSEFRQDSEAWIGGTPDQNVEGYRSRGGITTVENLRTPLHIDHGDTDVRVTVEQARRYVERARSLGREVTYLEWPDVGDRRHWSNLTVEQDRQLGLDIEAFLRRHTRRPEIPARGELVVAGYVKSRRVEVVLDHIDRIARLRYDLTDPERARFELSSESARRARIRFRWSATRAPAVSADGRAITASRSGDWFEVEVPGTVSLLVE